MKIHRLTCEYDCLLLGVCYAQYYTRELNPRIRQSVFEDEHDDTIAAVLYLLSLNLEYAKDPYTLIGE
jgi:hypothetical protein